MIVTDTKVLVELVFKPADIHWGGNWADPNVNRKVQPAGFTTAAKKMSRIKSIFFPSTVPLATAH